MTQAAVAVITKEKSVLICQRKKNSRYGLKWEFPGGKVEEGESFFNCLKRELVEELSIVVESFDRSELQVNHFDDGGVFEVTYFFVSRSEGSAVNNVFEQIRWVSLAELKSCDMLEGNKSLAARMTDELFE